MDGINPGYTRRAVTLDELARRLECRLEGDGGIQVTRVASLDDAGPGDLTFLANAKYASRLPATRASAVLTDDTVTSAPCANLRTQNVYLSVMRGRGGAAIPVIVKVDRGDGSLSEVPIHDVAFSQVSVANRSGLMSRSRPSSSLAQARGSAPGRFSSRMSSSGPASRSARTATCTPWQRSAKAQNSGSG